ncbi:MAG TPA: TlpA disulfide reductase family protein [Anaeromyxobacteraceae bacterium]|nr:TlpA disulfide reductase family protein [Anaeromyxobacteraceae bacterium]
MALLVVADRLAAGTREPGIGGAAPPLVVRGANGRGDVDLGRLRGRAVAVNFWAPWCGPCQAELPDLAAVKQELSERCVELVGIAGDSTRAEVERLAARQPYPVAFDETGAAMRAWRIESLPTTVLVDPEGKIQSAITGAVTREQLVEALRPLIPATCPGLGP